MSNLRLDERLSTRISRYRRSIGRPTLLRDTSLGLLNAFAGPAAFPTVSCEKCGDGKTVAIFTLQPTQTIRVGFYLACPPLKREALHLGKSASNRGSSRAWLRSWM